MMDITKRIDDVGVEAWDDFNKNHPHGNFYQSSSYYFAVAKESNHTPLVYFAIEKGLIRGILLLVIQKESLGPLSFLSARAVAQGGPIAQDNNCEIIKNLLLVSTKGMKNKVIYTQYRNFYDTSKFSEIFKSTGFYFEEHLNILVDLTKTEEQLWKDVHSKRRNEIRRARKEGTIFDASSESDIVRKTHDILIEVYNRAKLPLPSVEFFNSLYKNLGSDVFKIFVAKNNGKIIGTMYAFCYKETIIDWYAGALSDYYKKYPNDLIPWEVFIWGKEKGFKLFDFGGAGKPNIPYGVREYKKKFGGELVNFGRYERINNKFIFKVSKFGFLVWQKIKGK